MQKLIAAATIAAALAVPAAASAHSTTPDHASSKVVTHKPCKNKHGKKCKFIKSKKARDGKNGVNGANGANGVNGRDGSNGVSGKDGARGPQGIQGMPGLNGKDGKDGVLGGFYSVQHYADANSGAIATVACDPSDSDNSQKYVAIAGGVQVVQSGSWTRNTPVSSSFPGRMDWSNNTPKAGRLDGWIVQFGGNAGGTQTVDPMEVNIWAFCAPKGSIAVHTN
jgi:Collagen triple helix repeat (20 copies)